AIYQQLLTRYDLKPEECVFIDDRKDNVDAAIALGMSGIVYPGSAQELVSILYPMLGARNF
ncbi:MAG: HAD-IA family hydrolase, partial [Bacteroidaceae bacterium]